MVIEGERIQFKSDRDALHSLRDRSGREVAEEEITDDVAGVGGVGDDLLHERVGEFVGVLGDAAVVLAIDDPDVFAIAVLQ